MKNKILTFVLCCSGFLGFSQITITNANFPVIGDTLKTIFVGNFNGTVDLGTTGGNQSWNFNNLGAGIQERLICKKPTDGMDSGSFPNANMLISGNGQSQYLISSATKIEALGFGGQNPFLGGDLVVNYIKKPVFRVAPVTMSLATTSISQFNVDLGTELIPDSLLATLPIKPDSIRVQFNDNTTGLIDAWGTLKLNNKSFNCLREKSLQISETKVYAKVPFLGWLELSGSLVSNLPGGFSAFLGVDTTTVYNFYSDTKKETLVSVEYGTDDQLQSVTYADLGTLSASEDIEFNTDVKIYPNPASDIVHISTQNIREGKYLITISDISGRVHLVDFANLSPNSIKEIRTSDLAKGLYILNIRMANNSFNYSSKISIF